MVVERISSTAKPTSTMQLRMRKMMTTTNDDDEDQDVSDEENEDDNEEDDDDDDNDFSDSDTDDEEEKHGWEKMDHEGKEYYWNWDTEETVWERPDGYRSPGAESSGEDSPGTEEDDQHVKSKGPAALYLEHIKKKRSTRKKTTYSG